MVWSVKDRLCDGLPEPTERKMGRHPIIIAGAPRQNAPEVLLIELVEDRMLILN
jgi:hypothetical protein